MIELVIAFVIGAVSGAGGMWFVRRPRRPSNPQYIVKRDGKIVHEGDDRMEAKREYKRILPERESVLFEYGEPIARRGPAG
jgi:hypothetical protein